MNTQDETNLALLRAVKKGCLSSVKYLVEQNIPRADIHAYDDHALLSACKRGHCEILNFLIKKGMAVTARNNDGLILAAVNGHVSIVERLIKCGVDVSGQDGNVAMRLAHKKGHLEVVQLLSENMMKIRTCELVCVNKN